MGTILETPVQPDWQGFISCIRREGTPKRVHNIELFLDLEIQRAIADRFGLWKGIDPADEFAYHRREIELQRFLGYDYVRAALEGVLMPVNVKGTDDTAGLKRAGGRTYVDEHAGPVTNWEEFEKYPWADPAKTSDRIFSWYSENAPEDMCIVAVGGVGHFAEYLCWMMGYETLCYALCEQRDLVEAIAKRLYELYDACIDKILAIERVKMVWGSDDMGFRGGPLFSPDDMREFVLSGHKNLAAKTHAAGRPYILHSCGNLSLIMDDLLNDVKIDGKHSFEDVIEDVTEAKQTYGKRIALLGGIDLDFLCRADEQAVRQRVRRTLDACMPGGGYCLGTGNSVANYVPLDNYLAMLDEGRRWKG
jgi:uroporphyrinogen decarboxylase